MLSRKKQRRNASPKRSASGRRQKRTQCSPPWAYLCQYVRRTMPIWSHWAKSNMTQTSRRARRKIRKRIMMTVEYAEGIRRSAQEDTGATMTVIAVGGIDHEAG